ARNPTVAANTTNTTIATWCPRHGRDLGDASLKVHSNGAPHPNRALLVIGLLRKGIVCFEGELVDEEPFVEEWHKHVSSGGASATVDPQRQCDAPTPALDEHEIAIRQVELGCVVGVHL